MLNSPAVEKAMAKFKARYAEIKRSKVMSEFPETIQGILPEHAKEETKSDIAESMTPEELEAALEEKEENENDEELEDDEYEEDDEDDEDDEDEDIDIGDSEALEARSGWPLNFYA